MYEHRVYPRGEEESELWPTRENRKLSGVGKRPRESRLSEYLLGENRLMREFAGMRKCLPSFVTLQFPTGSLDWRRFDVDINLMGEILNNEHYGGRSYRFEFRVPKEYPVRPPLVECVTPVFHPNIGEQGSVGLRMLRAGEAGISLCYGWQATDTIEGIIFRLYRLFFNPCNEDTFVLNKNAAYHYRRNPTGFKSLVRRVATATIFHSKQELNLPARNKYYSDSESFCSSTSSSQSVDYYH